MPAESPQKFLFDRDFTPPDPKQRAMDIKVQKDLEAELAHGEHEQEEEMPEVVEPTFSETDVQNAKDQGFKEGHAKATQELTTSQEQRLANTLDTVSQQITALTTAFTQDQDNRSRDAVAIAVVIVRKLFPALNLENTMAEIEHMITEAINRTSGAPSFIIRVPPDLCEDVEAKAHELAAQRGREDTITVMGDNALAHGDAVVEWDGGGMIRDTTLIWQEIDEIIERNLGGDLVEKHMADAEKAAQLAAETKAEQAATTLPESTAPPQDPLGDTQNDQQVEAQADAQEVVNQASVLDNTEAAAESPNVSPPPHEGLSAPTKQENDMQDAENNVINTGEPDAMEDMAQSDEISETKAMESSDEPPMATNVPSQDPTPEAGEVREGQSQPENGSDNADDGVH